MRCEARGRHVVDLAGTKAEVKEAEVRFTAGIAARRRSTWRGPPEMTALRQDITASPYRTFLLLSLIGLLLQIHSTTGKCFFFFVVFFFARSLPSNPTNSHSEWLMREKPWLRSHLIVDLTRTSVCVINTTMMLLDMTNATQQTFLLQSKIRSISVICV